MSNAKEVAEMFRSPSLSRGTCTRTCTRTSRVQVKNRRDTRTRASQCAPGSLRGRVLVAGARYRTGSDISVTAGEGVRCCDRLLHACWRDCIRQRECRAVREVLAFRAVVDDR